MQFKSYNVNIEPTCLFAKRMDHKVGVNGTGCPKIRITSPWQTKRDAKNNMFLSEGNGNMDILLCVDGFSPVPCKNLAWYLNKQVYIG